MDKCASKGPGYSRESWFGTAYRHCAETYFRGTGNDSPCITWKHRVWFTLLCSLGHMAEPAPSLSKRQNPRPRLQECVGFRGRALEQPKHWLRLHVWLQSVEGWLWWALDIYMLKKCTVPFGFPSTNLQTLKRIPNFCQTPETNSCGKGALLVCLLETHSIPVVLPTKDTIVFLWISG